MPLLSIATRFRCWRGYGRRHPRRSSPTASAVSCSFATPCPIRFCTRWKYSPELTGQTVLALTALPRSARSENEPRLSSFGFPWQLVRKQYVQKTSDPASRLLYPAPGDGTGRTLVHRVLHYRHRHPECRRSRSVPHQNRQKIQFNADSRIGKGIDALIEGETALAGVSRPLNAEEKKQGLTAAIIGYDAIAVFVHSQNPVRNLSREELKGIFTGKITNWRKVGGNLASVAPTTEIHIRGRATSEMFRGAMMDDADYGDFSQIDLPRDQLLQLTRDPNGICAVSIGLVASLPADVRKNIKVVSVNGIAPTERNVRSGAYSISRSLLLVTKGKPKGDVGEFIRFLLSPEGQQLVAGNFIPVRKK